MKGIMEFLSDPGRKVPNRTKAKEIRQILREIDTQHFVMRSFCVKAKMFHTIHHELLPFNAYLYAVREFALSFLLLSNTIR